MAERESNSAASEISERAGEATRRPNDLRAQVRAAYACDREGRESEAVVFYDAAWKIGVTLPGDERHDFMIGYGSTLKVVGRLVESERTLRQLLTEFPNSGAARVFLALTLHASGRSDAAVGELIELTLARGDLDETLKRYERAIRFYRSEL